MKGSTWTQLDKIDFLLRRVPWTVTVDQTANYPLLRCNEMPDATGSGDTPEEAERDFWESMRSSLESFIHFGDRPPVSATVVLPWEAGAQPRLTPTLTAVVASAKKKPLVREEPTRTSMPSTRLHGSFPAVTA